MIDLQIFLMPYCPPCSLTLKAAERLKGEFPDLRVTRVYITEQPQMAVKYQISKAPGVVVNGKLEFQGVVNESQLRDRLRQLS
ncbi:MAG: thioredoxin family protein [Dehalococcoidia bacterium]